MTRFTESEIEEVRSRADIVEVIGAHVRLRRAGRNFVGLCPFHNEKTPSFSVSPERGFFHCFGCGAGGTVFDFLIRMEGLTFPEALQSLAKRYGITLPERTADNGAGRSSADGDRASMFAANQLAAEFYANVLWNTSDGELARDYLKTRGITGETARAFMLGFAPQRAANAAAILQKRGLLEPALKLGLAKKDQSGTAYDMFRARLMFPIRDAQGRVIAFGGRVLDNRLPKYINSAESPLYSKARALYGLAQARAAISKGDRAIVVEGYIDVIALSQAGFKETVATLGTALTIEQLRLLSRYTRNILACFDGDDAGRKASLRALEVFLQAGLLGQGVFIPQGYDPDTLVRERGTQHFADLVNNSESLVEMFLKDQGKLASKRHAPAEEQVKIVERVAEKLRMIENEIEFNVLVRKAIDLVGFSARDEADLRRLARRQRVKNLLTAPPPAQPSIQIDKNRAEIGLIAAALSYPELRAEIFAAQPFASFQDQSLAEVLLEVCQSHAKVNELSPLIATRVSQQQKDRLTRMVLEEAGSEPQDSSSDNGEGTFFKSAKFIEHFELLASKKSSVFGSQQGIAIARQKITFFLRIILETDPTANVAQLRQAAMAANGDEAVAAAQAVIDARRRRAGR
ncbi:MAG: DNA primase [Deltaproteobacteria bacterium]|nr:DNA primase [Deltaproteobacteria bacterium]